jgi:hypothetical protein
MMIRADHASMEYRDDIRPEIRQYFIASNTDELPLNREFRNLVLGSIRERSQRVQSNRMFVLPVLTDEGGQHE